MPAVRTSPPPPARSRATGNLPAELTSFVGRRRLVQDVKAALASTRLLTLVGPGGVGKTRLALRVAADLERAVPDGVWLVELAGLHQAELVPEAVMSALGLRDQSGTWTASLLIDYLAGRRLLLLLDNCEHLLDPSATLVDMLLREAPDLRILATSRQALSVPGERVVVVDPLGFPAGGDDGRDGGAAHSEAVALFAERAAQAQSDFAITGENRDLVVELVRHLDGMPLAIELAAALVRTLGIAQILRRLDDRFHLLRGGARTAPERQQSLRAAIDWSYQLLDPAERAVLRRLSVFAGTFDLDAAEAVCGFGEVARDSVIDLLTSLVERSFVSRVGTTAEARYRLHETMREYAHDLLDQAGEEPPARRLHLDVYADQARHFFAQWMTPRLPALLGELDVEADNRRAALEHCLATPGERDRGRAMVAQLSWYWVCRALTEGVHWLERFLESAGGDDAVMAQALFARGHLALYQADAQTALAAAVDAEPRARACGDDSVLVSVLTLRALSELIVRDLPSALSHAGEAGERARALGDPTAIGVAAFAEAPAAARAGDLARGHEIYRSAADLARRHGNLYTLSFNLQGAGEYCIRLGRHDEAATLLREALQLGRQLDDRAGILFRIQFMVGLAAATGELQRAARLIGVCTRLQGEVGGAPLPQHRRWLGEAEKQARERLGDARFNALRGEGESLDRAAAVSFALDERADTAPRRTPVQQRHGGVLGRREREVASLVAEGLSNKEIATRLFLSERTVETHVYNILNKLGFNSRVQIARWVEESG